LCGLRPRPFKRAGFRARTAGDFLCSAKKVAKETRPGRVVVEDDDYPARFARCGVRPTVHPWPDGRSADIPVRAPMGLALLATALATLQRVRKNKSATSSTSFSLSPPRRRRAPERVRIRPVSLRHGTKPGWRAFTAVQGCTVCEAPSEGRGGKTRSTALRRRTPDCSQAGRQHAQGTAAGGGVRGCPFFSPIFFGHAKKMGSSRGGESHRDERPTRMVGLERNPAINFSIIESGKLRA